MLKSFLLQPGLASGHAFASDRARERAADIRISTSFRWLVSNSWLLWVTFLSLAFLFSSAFHFLYRKLPTLCKSLVKLGLGWHLTASHWWQCPVLDRNRAALLAYLSNFCLGSPSRSSNGGLQINKSRSSGQRFLFSSSVVNATEETGKPGVSCYWSFCAEKGKICENRSLG